MKKIICLLTLVISFYITYGQVRYSPPITLSITHPRRYFYIGYIYEDSVSRDIGNIFFWSVTFPSQKLIMEKAKRNLGGRVADNHPIIITFMYEFTDKKDFDDFISEK